MRDTAIPVAIVGFSARVPGAEDAEAFWRLLLDGRSAATRADADRMRGFRPELAGVDAAEAVLFDDVAGFDARLFDISPRMATWIDPQQRMLLEASWHALESAGIAPETLDGTDTAVYVSTTASDWRQRMADAGAVDRYSALGLLLAYLANRISYQYNLRGPSITIDTACSGGLTAVGLAVSSLRAGDCRCAIAASANHYLHGYMHAVMMRFGALSPSGRAANFDESADGYVRGEGVFCFVLKRLDDALADGDPVHAVIRGCRINHDGRAGGIALLDAGSQARLIHSALGQADLDLCDIGYVEMHAAGTPLGDARELHGILRAFALAERTGSEHANGPEGKLWVGSVKATIGHLEGAAGAASLAKAVLVVRNGVIPGVAGLASLNPRIDLTGTAVRIARSNLAWAETGYGPRRAAVNSCGVGGSNAHLVIEQPPRRAARAQAAAGELRPVPLSTATETAMTAMAAALRDLLDRPDAPPFDTVAWTLQTGRAQLKIRRVLLARDRAELRAAAADLAAGAASPAVLLPGQDSEMCADVGVWLKRGDIDWAAYWPQEPPIRAPLMLYPFQRQRYWFDEPDDVGAERRAP
jgi:acyl transferase domain-containing protein